MRSLRLLLPAVGLVAVLAPAAPASAATDTLADQMHRLRVCESSNNYRANTGNGYYGAYQYSPGTWKNLGYAGRPDRAPVKAQDDATKKLHSRQGWWPWPGCAKQQHLH